MTYGFADIEPTLNLPVTHPQDERWDEHAPSEADIADFKLGQHHLTPEDVENMPAPEWLLDGWLVRNTLALLWGEWNAGKSFLALTWAGYIGSPRCAHWLTFPLNQAKVLYVAGEGVAGLGPRLRAFKIGHKLTQVDGVGFIHGRINMLDKIEMGALERLCKQENYELVVWDTLARMIPAADENSSRDVGPMIDALDRLREIGCGSLVLHHGTKDGRSARGVSAFLGACDTEIELTAKDQAMTLTCLQQRDGERPDSVKLWREPIPGTGSATVIDGLGRTTTSTATNPNDVTVRDALDGLPGEEFSMRELEDKTHLKRSTLQDTLQRLTAAGTVEYRSAGRSKLYKLR